MFTTIILLFSATNQVKECYYVISFNTNLTPWVSIFPKVGIFQGVISKLATPVSWQHKSELLFSASGLKLLALAFWVLHINDTASLFAIQSSYNTPEEEEKNI